MQIYGPFRVSTTQNTSGVQRTEPQKPMDTGNQSSAGTPVDQLDLTNSAAASRLNETGAIAGGGEIRIDRVAEIRRQIADGTFETSERLDGAVERLLDRLA